jgi:putative oxidoreductase
MTTDTVVQNTAAARGFAVLDNLAPHAHWLLRLALASVFLFHGLGKFPSLEAFSAMMGLPVAVTVLVALAEVATGVLVIAGAFGRDWMTRLGAVLAVPVLIGAIALVHFPRWSFTPTEAFPMGGMEFQVVLLFLALYLTLRGNRA